MRSILLIVEQTFPNQHAFLEEVYAKLFPANGDKVVWIFRDSKKQFKFYQSEWHRTKVYIIPNEAYYSFITKFIIKLFLFLWMFVIIRRERILFIQVRNWIFGAYLAYVFKKLFRVRFIYQISFPVQEAEIMDASKSVKNKMRVLMNKVKLTMMKFILAKADLAFVISEEMKRKMISDGFTSKNMVAIPLGFPIVKNISPSEIDKLKKSLLIEDNLVVLYVGTLNSWREPEFMLDVLQGVLQHCSNVILLVVGGEPHEIRNLTSRAEQLGLNENIIFTGKVPRNKVANYIAISDVCLSPIPEIPIYMVSSPTKFFEYLGRGKPVVASKIPEQKKIIDIAQCGICTNFDVDCFVNGTVDLLKNEQLRSEMGSRGAAYANNNLSYNSIYEKVIRSYQAL